MTAEPLEDRAIPDAPLALTSEGIILADPTPDELLEPALFADPAGTPADGGNAPTDTGLGVPVLATTTTSSTSCQGTATVSVACLGNITEGIPDEPLTNYFRFSATGCGAPPATSVTVSYSIGGTAQKNTDYGGAITAGTVTFSLTSLPTNPFNSSGFRDVAYTAIDDDLDEATETVNVTILSATANTGAAVAYGEVFAPGAVTSGDYTVNKVFQGTANGGHESATLITADRPFSWWTQIGRDNIGFPTTERSIGVQIYHAGGPIAGVVVTLVRTGSTGTAEVKVIDGAGAEKDQADAITQADGVAYFTIRYKAGAAADTQQFHARFKNAENNQQEVKINVALNG